MSELIKQLAEKLGSAPEKSDYAQKLLQATSKEHHTLVKMGGVSRELVAVCALHDKWFLAEVLPNATEAATFRDLATRMLDNYNKLSMENPGNKLLLSVFETSADRQL